MCRWLAYSGSPILMEELLYKPKFSLIDQSLHSRLGVETTNGDGFGVGWYGLAEGAAPALFRGVGPAWSDPNLREIAGHVSSPLFVAHIRTSTGTAVQQTNSHPFRHGRWLWLHNGAIREFPAPCGRCSGPDRSTQVDLGSLSSGSNGRNTSPGMRRAHRVAATMGVRRRR